jgi:hypothetical protein
MRYIGNIEKIAVNKEDFILLQKVEMEGKEKLKSFLSERMKFYENNEEKKSLFIKTCSVRCALNYLCGFSEIALTYLHFNFDIVDGVTHLTFLTLKDNINN